MNKRLVALNTGLFIAKIPAKTADFRSKTFAEHSK